MNDTNERPAPPWRRLVALLYELLVVAAILLVAVMASLLLTHGHLDVHAWWYRIALLVAIEAYFVVSWVRGGQTLGMRAWRLHLRSADGTALDPGRAMLRFALVASPLLLLGLAYVVGPRGGIAAPFVAWTLDLASVAFDWRRRALHDILAGTWVAYRPAA